jgi:hypothetical protein
VSRLGLGWADTRSDEFTDDAPYFGIEVPDGYGCVDGCKACRGFRNEVRAARDAEQYVGIFFTPEEDDVFTPEEDDVFSYQDTTSADPSVIPMRSLIGDLTSIERITCAINLQNTDWRGRQVVVNNLIEALLS